MSDVILHLGGNFERIYATADWAVVRPRAWVVLSSERRILEPDLRAVLDNAGVDPFHVVADYSGWDTLTQFTETRTLLRNLGATTLYIVTEAGHMTRALRIARILYWRWNRGLLIVPVYARGTYRDPWMRVVKDIVRAWVYRETGRLWYSRATRARRAPNWIQP